jgi:hypothetical protein
MSIIAAATVAICILGGKPQIEGGGFIVYVDRSTPTAWCDYYGVDHTEEHALIFKGVRDGFNSQRGTNYSPGTSPEAADWDGGVKECGGGLHFSPCPGMTREFDDQAVHYLACPVRLDEMAVHPDGEYPQKCKAKRVASPCWEVDINGKAMKEGDAKWPPKKESVEWPIKS